MERGDAVVVVVVVGALVSVLASAMMAVAVAGNEQNFEPQRAVQGHRARRCGCGCGCGCGPVGLWTCGGLGEVMLK